ncbi:MAG: DNRLRE domain-containing protein [Candidatus Hydrogenedentes bacterium]|nr:DNRLRE domain-containing protein [Candidatus Hydrogenedentota bacterium]
MAVFAAILPFAAIAAPLHTYVFQQGLNGYSGFDDTSIFSESTNSGGGTDGVFSGTNNQIQDRRALIRADPAQIPPGAIVMDVQLRMVVESSGGNFGDVVFNLHRLTNDWGEGTAVGTFEGGLGAPPTDGDATWESNHHNVSLWGAEGGDFATTPSATQAAGQAGDVVVWSDAGMIADVQGWVDGSLPNNGWVIVSAIEGTRQRVKKFHSSEAAANRPMLTITVDLAAAVPSLDPSGISILLLFIIAAGVWRMRMERRAVLAVPNQDAPRRLYASRLLLWPGGARLRPSRVFVTEQNGTGRAIPRPRLHDACSRGNVARNRSLE